MEKFYVIKNIDRVLLKAIVGINVKTNRILVYDFLATDLDDDRLFNENNSSLFPILLDKKSIELFDKRSIEFSLRFVDKTSTLVDSTWRFHYNYEKDTLTIPGAMNSENHKVLGEFDDLDSAKLYFQLETWRRINDV